MSWFSRIEETCAAFIERAFANMFPSDVEPAQVARKLVATMEARTHNAGNAMRAPARYAVYVNPIDYARLQPHRKYLQDEWSALLSDVARRVGITFRESAPTVTLNQDDGVVAGGIDIEVDSGTEKRGAASVAFALRSISGMPQAPVFVVAGATRVGRNPQCDLVLSDPSVSRYHALLDVRDGNLLVLDAESTNGTYVNGERTATRELAVGDVVAFGKTRMRVETAPP